MPRFASRKVLIGAAVFAAIVVVASVAGAGAGALLFYLLYVAAVLGALYFVVRWAVAGARGAREILDARYAKRALRRR